LKHGYEIAQDPTEWDAEQKEIHEERENAANQVDELEDDDEEADVSATKRKKATKEKSKKKAKVSKVSNIFLSWEKYGSRRIWGEKGHGVGWECRIRDFHDSTIHQHCRSGRSEKYWNFANNQAEVEDEEDAPAPKATKSKADKSKKPDVKAEAAPADDGK